MPIFYFISPKHDKGPFTIFMNKFLEDVRSVRDHTKGYRLKSEYPYQCITDMSLVIFRPCLGKDNGNKGGYTATEVACGWAGAIFEVTRPFGQEQ